MQSTCNTLSEDVREQSTELLNIHLAAAIDLHSQLKQAHWNVRGPTFTAVHELFDKVAATVESYADQIAERAAALGAIAQGTVQVAAERTFLVPYRLGVSDEKPHLFAVASRLAAFGQSARAAIGTADLFSEVSRGVNRQLWFIEARAAPR